MKREYLISTSEGSMWGLVSLTALEWLDIIETGKYNEKPIVAIASPDCLMIYDFILRDMGLCPIRFAVNYQYDNYFQWAGDLHGYYEHLKARHKQHQLKDIKSMVIYRAMFGKRKLQ